MHTSVAGVSPLCANPELHEHVVGGSATLLELVLPDGHGVHDDAPAELKVLLPQSRQPLPAVL